MAHPILTASDLKLFGDHFVARDSDRTSTTSEVSARSTFTRWFVGTCALAMTSLTVALLIVQSAPSL